MTNQNETKTELKNQQISAAKAAKISAMILEKRAEGLDVREALDSVLGAGTFETLVQDLYAELRKGVAQ